MAGRVAAGGNGTTTGLAVGFGPEGLSSLSYGGVELLASKSSPAISVTGTDGKPLKLSLVAGGAKQANGVVTRIYDGLVVVTEIRQVRDVLNLTVMYRNTGKEAIGKVQYQPMLLHFPRRPIGASWKWGYDTTIDIEDAPGVIEAHWGTSKLVVCVDPSLALARADDTARPMAIGFAGNYGNNPYNAILFRTPFSPALAPGKSYTFRGSLRFASTTTPTTEVAKDIYEKFAKAYPPILNWPDRRPIGAIFIASSGQKWPTNPRGWFGDPKVDVTTEAGKSAFRTRLMKYADSCVGVMKKTGAQGMVFWDVEGGEMPHAITYLGDPRILPQAAPEMDAVADEFFKKFLDAGLRTGVCIRPSKIIPDLKGGWKHQQSEDHVSDLSDKIAYAKKRWGCTIFYMDTNVKWPMNPDPRDVTKGMWQGNAVILPSADLRELCRRHPDVLIFPEFGRFGYYSVCGVYGELRGGNTGVKASIRVVYPDAVMVLASQDGDFAGRWDDLRAGVQDGAIHVFRGWFNDPHNTLVKHMYQEVDFLRRGASVTKAGPLKTLLADTDPLVRFTAVSRLKKPTASETEELIKALGSETEWVVERKIVEVLGTAGDASAVDVLSALLRDPKRGLDAFAATAMGRLGPPATPRLIGFATGKDQRLIKLALAALAQSDDPAATATLLTLSQDSSGTVRSQAARALGRRPAPGVTARLVALLVDKEPAVVIAACTALGQLKDLAATKPLVELIVRSVSELKNNHIREAAGDALEAITGLQYSVFPNLWEKALADKKI